MALLKKPARKYRGEQSASQYIPYSSHVTESIISTVNGEYVVTFQIEGRSFDTASKGELKQWVNELEGFVRQIGDEHISIWTHLHHRITQEYQDTNYPSSFAQMLNDNYKNKFINNPTMVNDFYLSIVYNPIGDVTQKVLSKLEKDTLEEARLLRKEAVSTLQDIANQVETAFIRYGIKRLGIYYRDENGEVIDRPFSRTSSAPQDDEEESPEEGERDLLEDSDYQEPIIQNKPWINHQKEIAFSETLEFFSFLINGEWNIVPVGRRMICTTLQYNRTISSPFGDIIQIRGIENTNYTIAIEVRDYEPHTSAGQLDSFLQADYEFILTQTFVCMSRDAAKNQIVRQQKALVEANDLARSQTEELSEAADQLISGDTIFGWHHATVHVFGDTQRITRRNAQKAFSKLSSCGVSPGSVSLASEAAYYAMLPGNREFIPRPVAITSQNFICFSSFHNIARGKPKNNPWGDAVTMLETVSGSPYHFNWHHTALEDDSRGKRPAGHTLFLGKTGEGKTTLMNGLITFSTKYNPRLFVFDRDQGMRQLVMGLGGNYTVMQEGFSSGFQPFQMEPTRKNIAFAKRLVKVCAETTLNGKLHPRDSKAVDSAVESVMGEDSFLDISDRTMTTVMQQIPVSEDEEENISLVELLEPWCKGGEHGWLFDNPSDSLNIGSSDIHGFDISDFIVEKDQPAPPTRAPMLMYLLYRIRKTFDGTRRTIVAMDEFHSYLNDPIMQVEAKHGIKTDRKKDVIYVFATQEPNDAIESAVGKTVIQGIATLVMLPNPGASYDDYVNNIKLTEEEYNLVSNLPEGSRKFLIKQGSDTAVCRFDLSGMEKEISILSGTPDGAELCREIINELGTSDPDVWMPEFWKRIGRA